MIIISFIFTKRNLTANIPGIQVKYYTMEYKSIHLTTVNSTNSYLKELYFAGKAEEHTVVITDYQDAGRGQGQNVWISENQMNLLFSWIVFPAFLAVSDQFSLSKSVSLGIIDALGEIGLETKIKWPNDIMSGNLKIGGILIENSILGAQFQSSIIGIGLNVNQREFPFFPLPASSICNELGHNVHMMDLFSRIMENLLSGYERLNRNKEEIDLQYAERLYGRNMSCEFKTGSEIFSGEIIGVNAAGELKLDVAGSIRTYGFHELQMLIPHP